MSPFSLVVRPVSCIRRIPVEFGAYSGAGDYLVEFHGNDDDPV